MRAAAQQTGGGVAGRRERGGHLVADVHAQPLPAIGPALGIDAIVGHVLLRGGQPAVPALRAAVAGQLDLARVVDAARAEGDPRATRVLDADIRGEDPQVGVRDAGELALDRLEKGARRVQPRVLGVRRLRLEAHAGAVGAASAARRIVGAAAVPGEADEDRGEGAVIPRGVVHHEQQLAPHRRVVDGVFGRLC